MKSYDEALNAFEKALAIDPNYTWVYNQRGLLFAEKVQYEVAINDFNRAIELDPLGGMQLTEAGFGALTRTVLQALDPICPGRLVSLLEGGYDLHGLAASVESHLGTLTGD